MYDELIRALRCDADASNVCGEAADAIEELSKQLDGMNEANIALYGALSKWIPVTERVPEDGESVLVYRMSDNRVNPKMRIDVCPYLGDGIFCLLGVTHWMPLPPPPTAEEGE